MKITIEELTESRIAYFRSVGAYGGEQNRGLMESFKHWAQLNGVLSQAVILGIPQDNPEVTPKEECRYDVCVVVDQDFTVEQPAQVGNLPGGKYAVFLLDHSKEAISQFWDSIFYEIKKNNLSIRQQPIIERYSLPMIDKHLCELLVPIQ